MKYNRFVHIVIRDGFIKAVLTSASEGRKVFNHMRDEAVQPFTDDDDFAEYMQMEMEEYSKWRLEKWPLVKTMST